jgi:uncharacterized protein (TIGR03790 family)
MSRTSQPVTRLLKALWLLLALLLLKTAVAASQYEPPTPDSVVVVANRSADGSLKVAEAYMKAREIPERNLIVIESPESEQISRAVYLETVHNPILKSLTETGLINAIEGKKDNHGREEVILLSNPIRYLVTCYGVPVKITHEKTIGSTDAILLATRFGESQSGYVEAFTEGKLAINSAAVDSELSLLLVQDIPLNGFIPNPYYRNRAPAGVRDLLKVTRLDGPSPEAVLKMIGNGIKGEKKGLMGRAYVDEDGRKGPYLIGNDWLAATADIFQKLGFDLDYDRERNTFPITHRMDAPVLYAGWYAGSLNGPFTVPGFAFPPGAVAAHLHSYSAAPLRSGTRGWVGPLVDRGVSATFGNTTEPYLRMTHEFDAFFAALAEGWTFADAAYFAIPSLSWQGIAVGDPLFRPFSVPLEAQLAAMGNPLHILNDQYLVIRQINLLLNNEKREEALKLANRGMRETPGLALALKRAHLLEQTGKKKEARKGLAFLVDLDPGDSLDWGLYAEIADTLLRLGDARSALKIYRKLERQSMPEKVQLAFLKRGIQAAEKAGDSGLAIEWRTRVTPPPPPPKEEETVPVNTDPPQS